VSARVCALAVGATAHAALARTEGRVRVLARLHDSLYATAGEALVWLGGARAPLHPRAILSATPIAAATDEVRVEVDRGLCPWRPPPLALDGVARVALAERAAALVGGVAGFGTPGGFGALLIGARPAFPLDGAFPLALTLARACARDDPDDATGVALALLGLGAGLTPSGDDYVGGVLFVRTLAGIGDRPGWHRLADAVVAAAPARTHPISAALLADLAGGHGWAPLHDLIAALAAGDAATAEFAARSLVALGHTSGWDLLAGVIAGLGALPGCR
jgi:Protein of unknown function (DUF2877)